MPACSPKPTPRPPAEAAAGVGVIGQAGERQLTDALRGNGLWLDVGIGVCRVRSDAPGLADQLGLTYRHFPLTRAGPWADWHVQVRRVSGWRRHLRPQITFLADHEHPFDPFPADTALPMLEWGVNWLIGTRAHHLVLLHAGAVERDGLALLLPATPGSGKSTLTAALSLSGWRLLSDEFGAIDQATLTVRPVLKPVALKNTSIDIVRSFSAQAELGVSFPKTRKGTVAHLAPPADAVARRAQAAAPAALMLPTWEAGAAPQLVRITPAEAFAALAFNSFNYPMLGVEGFRAVVHVARVCPAWRLRYGSLDQALTLIDRVWPEVVAEHAQRLAEAEVAARDDIAG